MSSATSSFAKKSLINIILLNVCAYSLSLVLCLGEEVFCVQRRKIVSVIQTSQLMLHREIIAVCSQIHIKHINTAVWAERGVAERYTGGIYSDHWAVKY